MSPERRAAAGAYAIVRTEDPALFLAEDENVLARVLALRLVAQMPGRDIASAPRLREMREALLEERWADALLLWIEETGTPVDVYDTPLKVWTERDLDRDEAVLEIRVAPLFSD